MSGEDAVGSILALFESINRIPRKSKHEQAIAAWLAGWADDHGFDRVFDAAGNLIVKVPASPGRADEPGTVLQGHMDMVCEKTPDSSHDFSSDPIEHRRDGDWLTAAGTTLGADNGIALAMSMHAAVALSHPPLELLFTVDEETGLTGARNLDGSLIEGRTLINLDSEDEGVITVGCAGGRDSIVTVSVPDAKSSAAPGDEWVTVVVGGLQGGHSGVDIREGRGNAIRLLARVVDVLLRSDDVTIGGFGTIEGGSARNAIPRDASAALLVGNRRAVDAAVSRTAALIAAELAGADEGVTVSVESGRGRPDGGPIGSAEDLRKLVSVLLALPDGVHRMSRTVPGLVETSNNLGVCAACADGVRITLSVRSSIDSRIDEVSRRIESVARLGGCKYRTENSYPAWPARTDSPLLARAIEVHRTLFAEEPKIDVIHAGLECAVIGAAVPGIDMISIGPTIEGAHSPDERLSIASIGRTWRYLSGLLEPPGR